MRRGRVLAGLVAVVLCTAPAASAGAPRMALGTASLSLPAKGTASFAIVTITGTLHYGVSNPGLTLALADDPRTLPRTVEAAAGAAKRTTSGGRVVFRYGIWIDNRGNTSPKQKLDLVVVGAYANWGGDPQIYAQASDCKSVSALHYSAYAQLLGRRAPRTQLLAARRAAHCS